jgi:hypothetical protein
MTILEILFVLFLVLVALWFITNTFDFTTISLNAKTARRLGDLSIKINDWGEQRQAYGALNSRIHAEASEGMKCAKTYVKRQYADLFEKRLKRRGFQVEKEDYYEFSSTIRLIVSW